MIQIFVDGVCDPNPGKAAWAIVAKGNGFEFRDSGFLGDNQTNNDGEYVAIGKALRWLLAEHPTAQAVIHSDSQVAVRQIDGRYACNVKRLEQYRDRVRQLLKELPHVQIKWIPSEENVEADALSRSAYKTATGREARRYQKVKAQR